MENKKVKQVILVRKDIQMTSGEIATQVAHASIAVLLDLMKPYVEHDYIDQGAGLTVVAVF